MDLDSWYEYSTREAIWQNTEYFTVVGHGPLWHCRYVIGILRLFVHAFAPCFLRCYCGLPSRHVPGM